MTLEQWLQHATANLEAHAAQRICREYHAHLEDALAAGSTEAAFVAELGSARDANAGFVRSHLTLNDVLLLDAPRGPLHPRWLWLYGVYGVCVVSLAAFNSPLRCILTAALMLTGWVFWFWLRTAWRRRRLSRRQAGQLCWDAATAVSGVGMALASGQAAWLLLAFTVLTGTGVARWRKLRLGSTSTRTTSSGGAA